MRGGSERLAEDRSRVSVKLSNTEDTQDTGANKEGPPSATAVHEAVDALESNVEGFRAHAIWADIEIQARAACTYTGLGTAEDKLRLAAEIFCKVGE